MPVAHQPFTVINPSTIWPMVWVRLSNKQKTKTTIFHAKIDSGADACIFPPAIAQELDIDLESGTEYGVHTANGADSKAYEHKVHIEILASTPTGSYNAKKVLCRISEIPVYFIENGSKYLLGRKGFLEHFIVTFHYPHKVFSIKNPNKLFCPCFPS